MKKKIALITSLFVGMIAFFFLFDIIWTSPPFYKVSQPVSLKSPIMDMEGYKAIWQTHRRPYTYSIASQSGGTVHVLGVEHVSVTEHPDLDTIKAIWNKVNPDIAFVEGRLGFLFSWLQNPIKQYGEGGLVAVLAKRDNTKLYTWEPSREDEIKILMKDFSVEQIALFYAFRPYFSNMRHGKPENPEEKLQEYLDSRTDYEHIRGIYQSWEELDRIWQKDFPEIEWRDYSDAQGYPGYLFELWNKSNTTRDEHMVQAIIDAISQGKTVFISMGSSHAPRIEKALRSTVQ